MLVAVTVVDKVADVERIILRAQQVSTVSNSVKRGISVQIVANN